MDKKEIMDEPSDFHLITLLASCLALVLVIALLVCFFIIYKSRTKKEEEPESTSKYVYRSRDDSIVRQSSNAPVIDDDLPDGEGSQPITEPHQVAINEVEVKIDSEVNLREGE